MATTTRKMMKFAEAADMSAKAVQLRLLANCALRKTANIKDANRLMQGRF
jgi:hypothetical protein